MNQEKANREILMTRMPVNLNFSQYMQVIQKLGKKLHSGAQTQRLSFNF